MLNERDHSRTLDRSGDLGDMEPVKAAPLMVSSSGCRGRAERARAQEMTITVLAGGTGELGSHN